RTCVASCLTGGCDAGLSCDVSANVCRALCDATFPCTSGLACVGGLCVPECTTSAMCPTHRTCQAGQCVPDGTCATDLDCDEDRRCFGGACVARPTPREDGGFTPYTCTQPCDCRMGEWCTGGLCHPDALPTQRLTADAGLDLYTFFYNLGPNELVALREDDV